MSFFSKFLGLFRRRKTAEMPQHRQGEIHIHYVPSAANPGDIQAMTKWLHGQRRWPVSVAQAPREAAYWRRRNRRASASIRRASEAFAAAVIDALHEGIPT